MFLHKKNTEFFYRKFLTFKIGFMSVLALRARCLPQGSDVNKAISQGNICWGNLLVFHFALT